MNMISNFSLALSFGVHRHCVRFMDALSLAVRISSRI